MPQPQQGGVWASSVTYTIGHSNARSPTHWARPRIEPESLWILVGFVSTAPQWELPRLMLIFKSNVRDVSKLPYFILFILHILSSCIYRYQNTAQLLLPQEYRTLTIKTGKAKQIYYLEVLGVPHSPLWLSGLRIRLVEFPSWLSGNKSD